jgi:hypothetical protein
MEAWIEDWWRCSVFNAGAIGAGWVLSVDPKMVALLRNVLAYFGVKKPRA